MHWATLPCSDFFISTAVPFAAISISLPISRITDDRATEFGAMVIKAAKGSDAAIVDV
ncbi:IclR family transcriptional regulator C-terminal domain-containing protein [Escherichia coli]